EPVVVRERVLRLARSGRGEPLAVMLAHAGDGGGDPGAEPERERRPEEEEGPAREGDPVPDADRAGRDGERRGEERGEAERLAEGALEGRRESPGLPDGPVRENSVGGRERGRRRGEGEGSPGDLSRNTAQPREVGWGRIVAGGERAPRIR